MLRAHHCLLCGDPLPAGSRIDRQYCRDSCRTLASRVRKGKRRTPAASGQTLLQHISPSGATEQRPLSPLLALAVKHEDQEAELRAELADTRARLERLQREAEAEKQSALKAQAREVAELRQRLADKTRVADERAAENRALCQALEEAQQQLRATQEQSAPPALMPPPNALPLPATVQPPSEPRPPSASPASPPHRRLDQEALKDLVAGVLQSVEHATLAEQRHSPQKVHAFFVQNQTLLMGLSLGVAHRAAEEAGTASAASLEPKHILWQLEQQVAQLAPADRPAMAAWLREYDAVLRLVVDETVQAVRRAIQMRG